MDYSIINLISVPNHIPHGMFLIKLIIEPIDIQLYHGYRFLKSILNLYNCYLIVTIYNEQRNEHKMQYYLTSRLLYFL